MYSGRKKRNPLVSDIVYMAVLIFRILHPKQLLSFVSLHCITVHYNKLEEPLIYIPLCYF